MTAAIERAPQVAQRQLHVDARIGEQGAGADQPEAARGLTLDLAEAPFAGAPARVRAIAALMTDDGMRQRHRHALGLRGGCDDPMHRRMRAARRRGGPRKNAPGIQDDAGQQQEADKEHNATPVPALFKRHGGFLRRRGDAGADAG